MAAATGSARLGYTSLVLAAWQGDKDRSLRLFEQAREDACERGEGIALTMAGLSAAVLYNGLGRYDEALAAASEAVENDELGLCGWALVELIEAAARSGKADAAVRALQRLSDRTRRSATDWALGIEARSCALLEPPSPRPASAPHATACVEARPWMLAGTSRRGRSRQLS
jgi:tetratricopeptide (TPR) repeat protein